MRRKKFKKIPKFSKKFPISTTNNFIKPLKILTFFQWRSQIRSQKSHKTLTKTEHTIRESIVHNGNQQRANPADFPRRTSPIFRHSSRFSTIFRRRRASGTVYRRLRCYFPVSQRWERLAFGRLRVNWVTLLRRGLPPTWRGWNGRGIGQGSSTISENSNG